MLQIKPYEPSRLHATAALWLASWRSTGVTLAVEITYDDLAARIPVEIADQWSAFLAWEGDVLAGLLALKPATSCLDQLFVLPDAQGRGIGAALLDRAKGEMPDGMWLRTQAANIRARRFYERHGLRHTESTTDPRLGHQVVIYRWP